MYHCWVAYQIVSGSHACTALQPRVGMRAEQGVELEQVAEIEQVG